MISVVALVPGLNGVHTLIQACMCACMCVCMKTSLAYARTHTHASPFNRIIRVKMSSESYRRLLRNAEKSSDRSLISGNLHTLSSASRENLIALESKIAPGALFLHGDCTRIMTILVSQKNCAHLLLYVVILTAVLSRTYALLSRDMISTSLGTNLFKLEENDFILKRHKYDICQGRDEIFPLSTELCDIYRTFRYIFVDDFEIKREDYLYKYTCQYS